MSVYVICNSEMPLYRLPEGAKVIWLNSEKAPKSDEFEIIHGYDFCDNPEHVHNYLAGSLGAYVILQLLLEEGEKAPEKTTIWQYRKFVSQTKFGEPTKNYPGMYSVNKGEEVAPVVSDASDFFFPSLLNLGSIINHYASVHHLEDFYKYLICTLETGVLNPKETLQFSNFKFLIPGGIELGTFKTDWWKVAAEKVFRCNLAFVDQFKVKAPDNPVQKRAVAFCSERLGSYFLLMHLSNTNKGNIPMSFMGTMHTVSEGDIYLPGR